MCRVREERTGWRDEGLSRRHRLWGWDCPMIDLDFVALEYDKGKAVAIVEYKHESAEIQRSSHPSYRALVDLGNRASIPVIGCRYGTDYDWYKPVGLNALARKALFSSSECITEMEWVEFLYKLRGRELPVGMFPIEKRLLLGKEKERQEAAGPGRELA